MSLLFQVMCSRSLKRATPCLLRRGWAVLLQRPWQGHGLPCACDIGDDNGACVCVCVFPFQAPDWVDAEECHRCRVQFGVVTRKVNADALSWAFSFYYMLHVTFLGIWPSLEIRHPQKFQIQSGFPFTVDAYWIANSMHQEWHSGSYAESVMYRKFDIPRRYSEKVLGRLVILTAGRTRRSATPRVNGNVK